MIRITISTTLDDEVQIKEESELTPAAAIAASRFSSIDGKWMLDFEVLDAEKMGKTFAELGYGPAHNSAVLANVKNSKCA